MRRPLLEPVPNIVDLVVGVRRCCLRPRARTMPWATVSRGALARVATVALLSAAIVPPAVGQRALAIEPNAAVSQTLTDNYLLTGAAPAGDLVTRLSAGVGLRSQAGLLRGYLDYSLSSLVYARHSDRNEFQNALRSNLTADLLEGRARLVVDAGISQAAISAFGAQPGAGGLSNANSTELRTLRITPTFQGPLGPGLRYSGSLGYSISEASNTRNGDSNASNLGLTITPAAPGRLSWALDGTQSRSDYKLGRSTESDRVSGQLNLRLDELDLRLNANTGIELSNLATVGRQRNQTWGIGAAWEPSPRIRLAGDLEHRFFGQSHNLSLEYRTPLTIWRLSDARSVSTGDAQAGFNGRGTAYDLFFAQFASVEPDPLKRADLVNAFLRNNGIDPVAITNPGFLRSSATLDDRQSLSVAYRGVRSTVVVTANRSRTRRLDTVSSANDDLAHAGEVRLSSVALDVSHRLTPLASVSLLLSAQQGRGTLALQDNRQRQMSLTYSTRLTPQSTLSAGGRRSMYQTGLSAYAESAVFASYGIRF